MDDKEKPIKQLECVIGQYANYFDTGIWSMEEGRIVSPADLTIGQLKDFLTASGGVVYLRADGRFEWLQIELKKGGA